MWYVSPILDPLIYLLLTLLFLVFLIIGTVWAILSYPLKIYATFKKFYTTRANKITNSY